MRVLAGNPRPADRRVWLLGFLLVLLLAVRIALFFPMAAKPHRAILPDSQGYLDLAETLRIRGTFEADPLTEVMRTPGYPGFIAAIQIVAGAGLVPVLAAQVLLGIGIAPLLYALGSRAADKRVGWAAAIFWVLNLNSMFWPLSILSETLFAALLAAGLTLVVIGLRHQRPWLMASSGLLLGMSVVVRPIGIYLIPVWFLVLVFRGVRREGRRLGWRMGALLAVIACIPVFAWSARNYAVHGEFFFSKVSGSTLRSFILARAIADARDVSRSEGAQTISEDSDLAALALEIASESPWSIPKVVVQGLARTALATEAETWLWLLDLHAKGVGLLGSLLEGDLARLEEVATEFVSSRTTAFYWLLVAWGAAYAFVAWGAALVGWIRNHSRLDSVGATAHWLAALTTLYLVAVPLSNGDARFRMPADPLLAFMAGIAWLRAAGVAWRHEGSPAVLPQSQAGIVG